MPHAKNLLVVFLLLILGFAKAVANPDFDAGNADYDRSDWDGAITNFSKSIAASFNLYISYCDRAYAETQKGESNAAIADCDEAIKLYPSSSGSYYWKSWVELSLTNNEAALKDFAMGVRLGPEGKPDNLVNYLSEIYRDRARRQFLETNFNASITNWNMAIFIDPTNTYYYEMRGWAREFQGHSGLAMADAYSAIRYAKPSDDPLLAYELRAFVRCESDDSSGALEDSKDALKVITQSRLDENLKYFKNVKRILAGLDIDQLEMEGLQQFINGDNQKGIKSWTKALNQGDDMGPSFKSYLKKWIEKAQAKLSEKKS